MDASFLRRHDNDVRAWVLVAEWPPRTDVPDPDPLAVVHFTSADQLLTQCGQSGDRWWSGRINRAAPGGAGRARASRRPRHR